MPTHTSVTAARYAATNPVPPYPYLSRRYNEQGTVVLRVLVKADGTVGALEIASSSGYPLLDRSATSTVRHWRFQPATVDGKPVAEWYELSIPYKLTDP
jgi:protein TonB